MLSDFAKKLVNRRLGFEDQKGENCLIVYLGMLADTYRRRLEWIEAYKSRKNRSTEAFTLFDHAVVVSPSSPSPVIVIDS
jgi:hypothetical protein